MKKIVFLTISLLLVLPAAMLAQGFDALWKQAQAARGKDLPKTELVVLEKIAAKAGREGAYGHLLKAELRHAAISVELSPDSLRPVVERLEKKAETLQGTDGALAAVYNVVLGKIYKESDIDDEEREEKSKEYFRRAFKEREMLATHKASEYDPMVVKGAESRYFDNDLFSMLAFEAEAYHKMHKFYSKKGNRVATMWLALRIVERDHRQKPDDFYPSGIRSFETSLYREKLDSLIAEYGDMPECGEVAIALFEYMDSYGDVPVASKVEFIDNALERWGSWMSMNTLRNHRSRLTLPMFTASIDKVAVLPGRAFSIPVDSRNIKKLNVTIANTTLDGATRLNPENANEYSKIKAAVVKGSSRTVTREYAGKKDYETVSDTISVEALPVGVYLIVVDAPGTGTSSRRSLLYVTDIHVLHQALPGDMERFVVVSATTGQPVPNAKVVLSSGKDRTETIQCGPDGEAVAKTANFSRLRAESADDKACPFVGLWDRFSYYGEAKDRDIVNLYTDRAIYRPGQTVHVSAIAFRNERGKELSALPDKEMTLTMRDANRKVVAEKNVCTDSYGNASVQFVLPSNVLTGVFSISSNVNGYGYATVRVEQYKRPAFRVEFDEVKDKYSNGDTLTISGRATTLSGVPVQGAKVRYNVSRRIQHWWWMPKDADKEMAAGETVTDADGTFRVRMPMILPAVDSSQARQASFLYKFTATADVTDVGGETHSGELSLSLGNKPVMISCDMPQTAERDSLECVLFRLRNAAGTDIEGRIRYYIDNPENAYTVDAGKQVALQWGEGQKAASGRHQLVATCEGDTLRMDFTLFSIEDTIPCCDTRQWFYKTAEQFPSNGAPVLVQIGSSDKDVHVVYSLVAGNKVLESGTFRLDNSVVTRKFEYREEYGDGVVYTYAWVKDGEEYTRSVTLNRPMPDKGLRMKWTTFRDRLVPGQKETWTLNVANPDGTPSNAHLMAAMYDKSLDMIAPFGWNFNTYIRLGVPSASWFGMQYGRNFMAVTKDYLPLLVNKMQFNRLDFSDCWPLIRSIGYKENMLMAYDEGLRIRGTGGAKMMKPMAVRMSASKATLEMAEAVSICADSDNVGNALDAAVTENGVDASAEQVRENLNETAFFYPALVADEKGDVKISFTLPESVTTWKFMGLAYDKAMNNGLITSEAVAKKDIMVQPNVPRFVRKGDNAVVTTRIFNTSDKDAAGTVRMLLVDPESENVVLEQKKAFSVETGATESVSFVFDASNLDNTLYIYKVVAEGKGFSDGEQHWLPVLPDAEMVTNTLPFTILEKGKKTFDVSALLPQDKTPKKLTVEYAANPAWLMVQALPFVGNANEDNAISLAAAYYANSLAGSILDMSPETEKVFRLWQQEQGRETSLMSSLQKNEELKAIALDETPWVMGADDEAGRKNAVANFFDKNTLGYNIGKTIDGLKKLQNADGSFSWWKGMNGSMHITATVMELVARLDAMGAGNGDTKAMMDNAARYLGSQVVKEVAELRKHLKKGDPKPVCSSAALQFVYYNALTGRKLSAKEADAEDFVIKGYDEAKRGQSLYVKAVMAFVLSKKAGKAAQAKEYAQSLKEYTVYKEGMGRYYDTPRAGYSWRDYRIPTQTMAIEALQAVTPQDTKTIDEMRRWLLQEKRTQAWDTPINSVNAVYAFLNGNVEALSGDCSTGVEIDGKRLNLPKATAGVGYVKAKADVVSAKTVTVEKRNDGTSWGAVYAQFMQPLSEVPDAASGLSVKREIAGMDKNTTVKVGDRIKVRITIRADRDYDFVQVIDKRAACLEPVSQLSGYHGRYYAAPKDNATCYYFDVMRKGTHVVETEYYVDRPGTYQTGTCTVQCAYSPEFMARTASNVIEVKQ